MLNFVDTINAAKDLICSQCTCEDCSKCPWEIEQAIEEVDKYILI